MALMSGGGHGDSRFLAKTCLADGALFDVVGQRNELTVVCPGMMIFLPTRVVQCCLNKLGSGTSRTVLRERALRRTSKRKPPSGGVDEVACVEGAIVVHGDLGAGSKKMRHAVKDRGVRGIGLARLV